MKIGFWELVVIVIVAFVFIGPDQLPVYAKKIQAPLKEAVAPLTDIKKDIDNSVKDVTKGFTGIGKTSKEEAAKKAAEAEAVEELTEDPVEELPEEPAAPAETAEEAPAEAKAEEKPAEAAPVEEKPAETAAPAEPAAAEEAAEAAPAEEAKV